jgi:glycosyltransferase involved in cell wall biosynthesis
VNCLGADAEGRGSVSIVVPTFNRLDYLRPALDSVFAQTWTDWDLIVADDGSGEELRAYLRQLDDRPRVKVLRLPHSGIPAAVRNAGVREATGAYVAFLDSDDLWAPHKLERQIAAMRARPLCRWSYTAFRRVDRYGNVLAEERQRPWHPYEGAIFEQLVTGRAAVRTPSVLVARELLLEVGGFDERIRSCEDYDLWMRFALCSPVAIVDEPLVQVRLHDCNHALDWAAAFHGRDQSLVKLHERVDRSLWPLLRRERARNSAGLIAEHARRGERRPALAALLDSVPHAWRYPEWWTRALRATARVCLPIDPRRWRRSSEPGTA